MAVIRYSETGDNTVNYLSTLAFFCCVSCITLMLKFGRFKTSFDVSNEKKRKPGRLYDNIRSSMSINGAYRSNRDEFFIYNNYSSTSQSPSKSTATAPVPPQIPKEPGTAPLRQIKSTSDLLKEKNLSPKLRPAQSGVSLDPRGADSENTSNRTLAVDAKTNKKQLDAQKKVEKQRQEEQKKLEKQRSEEQKKLEKQRSDEQKKLEKQRLDEQKKLEKQRNDEQKKRGKLAQQEQAKEAKLQKERQKKEAQQLKKDKKTKKAAPQRPLANPLAQSSSQTANNPLAQGATNPSAQASGTQYSTNTLDSSISKTSGPPPYSEVPTTESNSNVTFSKPVDEGSWDMISQHRHNVLINRPVNAEPSKGKQTTMDLNYSLGGEGKDNSDA